MHHVLLEKIYTLHFLRGLFCIYMFLMPNWFVVFLKFSILLFILFLDFLSVIESYILRSPNIIIEIFISPQIWQFFFHIFLSLPIRGVCVCNCYIFLVALPFKQCIANICWIIKKAREFKKNINFGFIYYAISLWLCGSQTTVENSERDGNTRPPDLPLEKFVCKSGSNS